jgi:hypothetical protein
MVGQYHYLYKVCKKEFVPIRVVVCEADGDPTLRLDKGNALYLDEIVKGGARSHYNFTWGIAVILAVTEI